MAHIIDKLAMLSGVMISDLHYEDNRECILQNLKILEEEKYSLENWNELICYLCNNDLLKFSSVKEAMHYLTEHLQ
ncbi:hypothetical protein [Amedibacillus sp. YH-ame10]